MRRQTVLPLAILLAVAACSAAEGVPATVTSADGATIGSFGAQGFQGPEPELMALLDDWAAAVGDESVDLEGGSVEVATALDPALQSHVRQVLGRHTPPGLGPQSAAMAIRRSDAAVVAIASNGFADPPEVMEVLVGSGRPTGSALKPFALAAGLDAGLTLGTRFPAPECIALPDNPSDQTCGGPGGDADLLEATTQSLNPVYVQLVDQIGVGAFAQVTATAGVDSGSRFTTIDSVLGTNPVPVIDLVAAYRTIAEGGQFREPTVVTSVRSNDDVLWAPSSTTVQVLDPTVWGDVDLALGEVVAVGTGRQADPGFPVAGKTGTARDLTDAWFVGYTDDLVVAVWVGFADDPGHGLPCNPDHHYRRIAASRHLGRHHRLELARSELVAIGHSAANTIL